MQKLDERKIKVIEDLAEGIMPKTEIATKNGIARQTIYDWLDMPEFKAELDRRLQQRKVFTEKKFDGNLDFAAEKIFETIRTTKNERVKSDLLKYVVDRALGKPTSKHEVKSSHDNQEVSDDILDAEFEEWEVED